MDLNWNFRRGGGLGVQTNEPSVGGVWIFLLFAVNVMLNLSRIVRLFKVRGVRGWQPERINGGGRCMGGGKREVGKQDFQGDSKWDKKAKIIQQCNILQSKSAKRHKPTEIGWELGLKGAGSRKLHPPRLPR